MVPLYRGEFCRQEGSLGSNPDLKRKETLAGILRVNIPDFKKSLLNRHPGENHRPVKWRPGFFVANWNVEKIISGGQTGVDRAALDAALELEIPCGGWCPRGRRGEDGPIPERYPLQESSSSEYPVRTDLNVQDSDGTLILTGGPPAGGTLLTLKLARRHHKSLLVLDLLEGPDPDVVRVWGRKNGVRIMNVAGPREGEVAGIHKKAFHFLQKIFSL